MGRREGGGGRGLYEAAGIAVLIRYGKVDCITRLECGGPVVEVVITLVCVEKLCTLC